MKLQLFLTTTLVAAALGAQPAAAQIFWQSPDYRGLPITPGELGIGVALPGATPEEERANLAWQMRAGLNVMALQCQFDTTLLSQDSYNGILTNHKAELAGAYATLTAYFKRMNKTPKAGRDALDRYGTKTYIGFSTVRAQLSFCQEASRVAKIIMFTPRGSFATATTEHLRALRNSLVVQGEQQFRFPKTVLQFATQDLSPKCWDGKGRYKSKCGVTFIYA